MEFEKFHALELREPSRVERDFEKAVGEVKKIEAGRAKPKRKREKK